MPSTITVRYESQLTVVTTLTGPGVGADDTTTIDQFNSADTYSASTAVPVTKKAAYQKALSTGTATIDLTALPGDSADETVNGTGLKLQFLKLRNPSANANVITATKGASNGYGLGAAGGTWTIPLDPGQEVLITGDESNPDVAGGAKTIDLSGTGSQALDVEIVLG